jgi:hypothetical protein
MFHNPNPSDISEHSFPQQQQQQPATFPILIPPSNSTGLYLPPSTPTPASRASTNHEAVLHPHPVLLQPAHLAFTHQPSPLPLQGVHGFQSPQQIQLQQTPYPHLLQQHPPLGFVGHPVHSGNVQAIQGSGSKQKQHAGCETGGIAREIDTEGGKGRLKGSKKRPRISTGHDVAAQSATLFGIGPSPLANSSSTICTPTPTPSSTPSGRPLLSTSSAPSVLGAVLLTSESPSKRVLQCCAPQEAYKSLRWRKPNAASDIYFNGLPLTTDRRPDVLPAHDTLPRIKEKPKEDVYQYIACRFCLKRCAISYNNMIKAN